MVAVGPGLVFLGANSGSGTGLTIAAITITAGTGLLVGVASRRAAGAKDALSVIWNGTENLAAIPASEINVALQSYVEWWWLANPTATTANVVITYAGATTSNGAAAMRVSNAHPTAAPLNANTKQKATDFPSATANTCNIWTQQAAVLAVGACWKNSPTAFASISETLVNDLAVGATDRFHVQRVDPNPQAITSDPFTWTTSAADAGDGYMSIIILSGAVETSVVVVPVFPTQNRRQGPKMVWTTHDTGYCFYIDTGGQLVYTKTTSQGSTWAAPVLVLPLLAPDTAMAFDVWNAAWTPGLGAQQRIYIAVNWRRTAGNHLVLFRALNTTNDTMTTAIVETAIPDFDVSELNHHVAICRSKGSNLYIGSWQRGAGDGYRFYRSTDDGVSWSIVAPWPQSTINDKFVFIPGNETDPEDIYMYLHHSTSGVLANGTWDNSLGTWGALGAVDTIDPHPGEPLQLSAAQRGSDGRIFVAVWSAFNTAGAQLRIWRFVNNTNFVRVTDAAAGVGKMLSQVSIDHDTGTVYVCYFEGTALVSGNIRRVVSTDDGVTWSAPLTLTLTAKDYRSASMPNTNVSGSAGGARIQPVWFDDDTDAIETEHISGLSAPVETGQAPDIALVFASTLRANGTTIALGTFLQESTAHAQAFIVNFGLNDLDLGTLVGAGDVSIFAGDNPSGAIVNPKGVDTVTIVIATASVGAKTGTLTIPSNDPDEASFVITWTATVVASAVGAGCYRYRCRPSRQPLRRTIPAFS